MWPDIIGFAMTGSAAALFRFEGEEPEIIFFLASGDQNE